MALAAAPFAAQAETWNIYGWQNHSWEFVDIDGGRSFDRIQSNAGNIGFAASVPTGMNDISVNVRCEQFTFYNQFANSTASTWCNRNSKIGLSHPQAGEIMFATWLLPYNEGVAQWVDPFYDAGADSHTNIMGSMGASSSTFYNPVFGRTNGFNRRQENIIQYWSPNWNGFVFRFAWTLGHRDEMPHMGGEIDPVIRSSSLAYTNGPLWLAVTWQDHEDWAAASTNNTMTTSDAESFRIAGRYIMDLGDGVSIQLAAMWEDIEHEFNGVTSVPAAMDAFGYKQFDSYNLMPIGATAARSAVPGAAFGSQSEADQMTAIRSQKTYDLILGIYGGCFDGTADGVCPTELNAVHGYTAPTADDILTPGDESAAEGAGGNGGQSILVDTDDTTAGVQNALATALTALHEASDVDDTMDGVQAPDLDMDEGDGTAGGSAEERNAHHQYTTIKSAAETAAMTAWAEANPGTVAVPANPGTTAGQNVKIERDAWMVSGKIKFGGPIDFRFSYADADDMEVSCMSCSGDWDESGGDAWNVGLFYTMPAGTELRMTYSEVNSDNNIGYGQSIPGTGVGDPGNEIEMFAVGIVHWFD